MRVVVSGASGRMGRELVKHIFRSKEFVLAGALVSPQSPFIGKDVGLVVGIGRVGVTFQTDSIDALGSADTLIDFTVPSATCDLARLSGELGVIHVTGTTGFSPDEEAFIASAAQKTAIIKSGNMSLGLNLVAALVEKAAAALGDEFDISVIDFHHRKKVDSPSGAALILGAAAAQGRPLVRENIVCSLPSRSAARQLGQIEFASLRGGTVVGDHKVVLAGPHERIELSHIAEDRAIFAIGALRAASWARDKGPGLYSMRDVLGI